MSPTDGVNRILNLGARQLNRAAVDRQDQRHRIEPRRGRAVTLLRTGLINGFGPLTALR